MGPLPPGQAWALGLLSLSFGQLEKLGVYSELGRSQAVGWMLSAHSSTYAVFLSFIWFYDWQGAGEGLKGGT